MEKEWRLRKTTCLAVCMLLLGGLPVGAGAVPMSPIQERIIAVAERMIGGRYEHGGYDPEGRAFDCVGFVRWVYHTAFEAVSYTHLTLPTIYSV